MKTIQLIAVAAALAGILGCRSNGSAAPTTSDLLPIDYDAGPAHNACGAMLDHQDRLMPIDYDTGPNHTKCGAMVVFDDALLPIDFDTGPRHTRCPEVKTAAECACCLSSK